MEILYVYSRRGCHLCELLLEELLPMVSRRLAVEVRDIDSRDDWRDAYNSRVPVVEFDNKIVCECSLDRDAVRRILRGLPASA